MMQESLPERLRVLRARRGLTLREAAARAGIGRDTLSNIERGRTHPLVPTLTRLARAYEVPVEELLEEPVGTPKADAPEEAPRRREEAAFVIVGSSGGFLVRWNVPPEKREKYRPALDALFPEGYLEDELPAEARDLLLSGA